MHQLVIKFSTFVRYGRKTDIKCDSISLNIDFKEACDSARREALYNMLTETS
jgi:hypothetical protein